MKNKVFSTIIMLVFLFLIKTTSIAQSYLNSEKINQNKYSLDIKLEEIPYTILNKNGIYKIHFIDFLDESKPGSLILPTKNIYIAIPLNSYPKIKNNVLKETRIQGNPEINPLAYTVDDSTVMYKSAELKPDLTRKPIYEFKGYLWINNNYCIYIKINQYQFDYQNFAVKEINEIKIDLVFDDKIILSDIPNKVTHNNYPIINQGFASNYKYKPQFLIPNTDGWIDYNNTYLKIGTAADAIYRMGYDDLIDFGVNVSGINPKTFTLINKGNPIPIYVEGENDGSFDENDFIEFVGIRNMGEHHRETSAYGQPYKEYLGVN